METLAPLISQLRTLAAAALPAHEDFTNAVLQNRITAQNEIEHSLDYMLDFCFDERTLLLYKKILRHILPKYPDTVSYYVNAYREWYDNEEGGEE
jgi:hypothetical protein